MRPLFLRAAAALSLSVLLLPAPAFAADKQALARELMALTGADQLGQQMMDAMLPQFQQMGMPPEFMELFKEKADVQALVDQIVPLYADTYDEKTLKAAIAFYKTPEGRKLIGKQPEVQMKAMQLGQTWGAKLGQEIAAQLQAQGPQGQ